MRSLLSKTAKTRHSEINIYAGFRQRMCDFQICAPCAVQKPASLWILGEEPIFIFCFGQECYAIQRDQERCIALGMDDY